MFWPDDKESKVGETQASRKHPGFECIVFDLDGTLLDTREALFGALDDLLGSLHRPPADREALSGAVHHGLTAMLHAALADAPLPSGRRLDRMESGLRTHYLRTARHRVQAFPGVTELLEALRARGIWLAVCSNQAESSVRRLLYQLDLTQHFSRIVGGDSLPRRKPDPMPLEWLMAQAGSQPERTLMVGDSAVDVACAEAAGCAIALMRHADQTPSPARAVPSFPGFEALSLHLLGRPDP